ncbi:hypothetical protein RN001_008095 [Aquatica leii]|uniref:Multidrug resistance-associated protein lethal(2)03659 n=1 Tax=Aquatica leii TaxID=1421715 RepID=A0AAN7PX50_9COLE|nr:hypothetical protein RN001_008095 [Aquatica leii]
MDSEAFVYKKKNPREKANPLSALFFVHMLPLFKKNYKKEMLEEELYAPLEEHKADMLGDKLEELWQQSRKYKKFGLHIALFKLVGWELVGIGVLKLINECCILIITPMATAGLVTYFQNPPAITSQEAYIYAAVLIGYLFISQCINHPSMMGVMHICMKLRVSCTSLIYRKSLRMSRYSLAQTTVGQIVNLLSNDVSKFDQNFVLCHYIIIGPIQTALGTYLLYRRLGNAAFYGIIFLILFVPLQIYIGKQISVYRLKTALRTDERVRLMNEILSGIQVIKMYTWEKPFAKLISLARRREVKTIQSRFFYAAIMLSLEVFITRTAIFISIITFVSAGATLTAEIAYAVTAIYNFIRPVMTMLFSISVMACAEVHTSIGRIEHFLRYEEQSDVKKTPISDKIEVNDLDKPKEIHELKPSISMTKLVAKWSKTANDNTLNDINFNVQQNELVAFIGPVGSGKSSLFNVILGELPVYEGSVKVEGKVSYASQEPWVFSASIKQNILFGDKYDAARYKTVVKICALESDLAMFPYGDSTIVGEKGNSLSGGQKARVNLARCIYKEADIYLLDDPLSAVDTKVGKQLFQRCIKGFLKDKVCFLITHQLQYLKETDRIVILKEGRILEEGSYNKLQTSGLDFAKLLQEFDATEEQGPKDKGSRSRQNSISYETEMFDIANAPQQDKEILATGSIKAATYLNYLKAGGHWCFALMVILGFIISQAAINAGEYFLAFWVNQEQHIMENGHNATLTREEITYIYSGLAGLIILLGLGHTILFFYFAMRVSVNLHDFVFRKISYACMTFFNANPTGRILNRFSKDLGIIDDYIPFITDDVVEISLILFGSIVLSAVVNPWFLLPSFILLVIFYILRGIFLYTSRSVKRIEGITRSPIFNHLTASINGLSTIRAFSAENTLIKEFNRHQDHHSSAWYLFISASRAFGFYIDVICNLFITSIILSFLVLSNDYYGGDVGLVITQYLTLNGILQWGMRQWSELENNMTSVERILEYSDVESEPIRDNSVGIPEGWPALGKISFQNVSMKYTTDSKPVLKNLDFTVYPGEKIGIVGRTGAGKTSTIAALFQLYEIEGSIIIDDIDTTKVPLDIVRSKLAIIPQEPVLFTGSIRKNLDPFDEYKDDLLWNALEQVELKEAISEDPKGLNMVVSEGGSNFSVGERQLLCLARAIIRNNKILVMDEATANVDPYTDGLIQKTIRKKFSQCTVLTIAHRLNTIMDSDRVLVISDGKAVEFDHPYKLLQHTDSIFYTMVETTGNASFKNLYSVAENRNKDISPDIIVCRYLINYRNSVHCTTNETPSFMMMGRKVRTLFDLLKPHKNEKLEVKGRTQTLKEGEKVLIKDYRNKNNPIFIEGIVKEAQGTKNYIFWLKLNINMESEHKTPKKRNFRENVNPFSALFFLHMFPVFQRNYKKGLKETDLCEVLHEQKANVLGDKLENLWKETYSSSKKYLLHKLLFCMFGFEFVIYGVLQLINELMLVALLPISVGRFISYFENAPTEKTESETYAYGAMIVLCILVNAFVSHSTAMGLMHISMKMAIACSSVIYRKSLLLSQTSLVQITTGHIINLLSTDISHFEYGLLLVHYIWIAPLQVILGIYLLYNIIGFAAFLGISLHLLFIPLQIYFGKKKSNLRLRTAIKTDTRVNLMCEILQGIKIIKMYAWEKSFGKLISLARRSEIKLIRSCYYLEAITHTLEIVLPGFSIFLSILAFIYLGNNIKASTVYSVIAIFDALRPTLTLMFSEGISNIAKVHITILRIEKLLSYDDIVESKTTGNKNKSDAINYSRFAFPKVTLNNVSAGWDFNDKTDLVIRNIKIDVETSKLVAVIGSVGSGKSSLLNVMLGELPIASGFMQIIGTTSYASQDPWLFPASVRQNILFGNAYDESRYKNVIKACSLESDINCLPYGDQTIVGERGNSLSGGQKARINLARCLYKDADIYLLDDPLSAVDAKVGKQLFQECIKTFLCNKICILITHQIQYLTDAHQILILNEGQIIGNGSYNELKNSGLNFAKLLPTFQNEDECNVVAAVDENLNYEDAQSDHFIYKENMEQKSVNANIYFTYFKYGGNVFACICLLSCFIASQVTESGYYFFISHWVDLEQTLLAKNETNSNIKEQRQLLIYTYSGITTAIITLALTQSMFFYSFFMRASINIHDSTFFKIIDATMSFFNNTSTGTILNRFSDDLGEIDEYIPTILADTLQISLQLVGVIIVTSIINYWFLFPSIGLLLFFLMIRNVYMKTSRNVKRIEGITRSPILGHMSATLQGITTIRAFGAENILQEEFDYFQDAHTSAWYLYISSNKAFTFWLDFICGIIASLIILSLLVYNRGYLGGDVGLVVNEFLSLMGVLQWGMSQWSELENHMTSVERVLEYKKIKTECVQDSCETVPKNWPQNGKLNFQNVSMSYTNNNSLALKNVSFLITPKQKIGIVGRTGAGKSSIISALFQLYDTKGSILIDDIDITKIPLEKLRSKVSIIPQEPFLFSGSIRRNLDPFEEFNDEVLWNALKKVQLKEEIENYSLGLHTNVTEAGSNFSVGQKQLICLARAIIRNNKILVLDEATANVDPHTDILIQETIRKTFADCTVITIAHRLHSVIDADRIMVLESGKVVEFDHPHLLLQDYSSKFYSIVQATGRAIAESLHRMAEINYNNIKISAFYVFELIVLNLENF